MERGSCGRVCIFSPLLLEGEVVPGFIKRVCGLAGVTRVDGFIFRLSFELDV